MLIFLVVMDLNPDINDDNDFGFIRGDEILRRGERSFALTGWLPIITMP
jgi:hypothetical protein